MVILIRTASVFIFGAIVGTVLQSQSPEMAMYRVGANHKAAQCPNDAVSIDYYGDTQECSRTLTRFTLLERLQVRSIRAFDFEVLLKLPNLRSVIFEFAGVMPPELFGALAEIKQLRELDLSYTRCTAQGLAALGRSAQLSTISLKGATVTGDLVEALAGVKTLSSLDIGSLSVKPHPPSSLLSLQKLQKLSAPHNDWVNEDVCSALPPKIRTLNLSGCRNIDDDAFALICNLPELADLSVTSARITRSGAAGLANLPRLSRLSLAGSAWFDDETIELIQDAPIVCLQLCGCAGIGYGTIPRIVAAWPDLEELDVTGCQALGRHSLSGLAALRKLRVLRLQSTRIANEDIAQIVQLRSISELDIGDTQVSDDGLMQISKLVNLRNLNISGLSASGDAWSECLNHLASLRVLAIANWKRLGATVLRRVGALNELEDLYLAGSSFALADLKLIAGRELRTLGLSNTQVNDETLSVITNVTRPRELYIDYCRGISAAGVENVAGCRNLRRLVVSWSSIDRWGGEDLQKFKSRHPHVDVLVTHP